MLATEKHIAHVIALTHAPVAERMIGYIQTQIYRAKQGTDVTVPMPTGPWSRLIQDEHEHNPHNALDPEDQSPRLQRKHRDSYARSNTTH